MQDGGAAGICPGREVYLYGSRAKETNLERSDSDIAVAGAESFEELLEIIEEIPTLYTIDVLNLDICGNQNLLEDIRLYGRKIYEKIS
ncbi:MAG: nucleotidyltransferase domain-containing protein [Lachnospiraceae bacterium]|nr:nucleotidyltransferase domain-containing protein [Lachnospiraceae bacterium]